LTALAQVYLECQHKHWPELIGTAVLPRLTDAVIAAMVVDFKNRHRTGNVDKGDLARLKECEENIGGHYGRYSCDNSSPLSIQDQLVNALGKARTEDRLIPWCYVFADYSVRGLDSCRQGYSSYKPVLADENQVIETTYIDDFTRASRDEIEWWKLAHLSRRLRKRMIGASDGFDLNTPDWDVKITIYGLISRLFIKSLREKVRRGMKGAAARGTCTGKPALGRTRSILRDAEGRIVRRQDGRPRHTTCIDPETRAFVEEAYERYAIKLESRDKIARDWNVRQVDGSTGWTQSAIRQISRIPRTLAFSSGTEPGWNFDWEEHEWIKVQNPRSEWVIRIDRKQAIISPTLWKLAQRRLAATRRANPLTGRPWSRNQRSATTLFSGTLFCNCCGEELKLLRSTEKYKTLACMNGARHLHGCTMAASKSTRIIEESLLGYLLDAVLTDENVAILVQKANRYFNQEISRPKTDIGPLKTREASVLRKIRNLLSTIEDEEDAQARARYREQLKQRQRELDAVRKELERVAGQTRMVVGKLDRKELQKRLIDARVLLNQEIPAAAEAIRALTGPIKIRQESGPGRKNGASWIAKFAPDLVRFLARCSGKPDYPDSATLEFLSTRIWITPETVEIPIDHVPKYERIADEVRKLADKGTSLETISRLTGVSRDTIRDGVRFSRSGVRPSINERTRKRVRKKGLKGPRLPPKKVRFSAEVARLRDQEKLPFVEIAKRVQASESTVTSAYDLAHQEAVEAAAEDGRTPDRGRCVGDEKLKERIRALLTSGRRPAEIARSLRCNAKLVYYQRRLMRLESVQSSAKRSSRLAKGKRHRAA
jgi:DNA invertase Pin-like site-specific DNA recombinase